MNAALTYASLSSCYIRLQIKGNFIKTINPNTFYYIISCYIPLNLEHDAEQICSHIY